MHIADSNTQGCNSHLQTHHKSSVATFNEHKAYVINKRMELRQNKEAWKRRASGDPLEDMRKQVKLSVKDGRLSVDLPPQVGVNGY